MPCHIGTSILLNTGVHAVDSKRSVLRMMGADEEGMNEEEVELTLQSAGEAFRDHAPTTAAQAATIILDGVKAERWRILIGDDAHTLEEMVRGDPEGAYDPDFRKRWAKRP
jgi:hypothetical protein